MPGYEDINKADKASVNYRRASSRDKRCKTCRYSYGPVDSRRCRKVKGQIKPDDVCDLWEEK
jgi:hypothetical protein